MNSTKHYKVIIIGAGPSGIGVAVKLNKSGIDSVVILERSEKIGGVPSLYKKKKGGVRTFVRWSRGGIPVFGQKYAGWLEKQILSTNVEVKLESQVVDIDSEAKTVTFVSPTEGKVKLSADAIIMANGAREENQAERKWIAGARPVRVLFTKQLLNLTDGNDLVPIKKPLIIGSDVIAYAAAAKLKANGADNAIIIDNRKTPKCPIHERLYFRLWNNPKYQGFEVDTIEIKGDKSAKGVLINGKHFDCDGIVISGDLIPNSELALIGKLDIKVPSRIPVVNGDFQFSQSGWFVAGNMLGGFHGAEWAFFNGKKVGTSVLKFISNN